MTGGCMAERCGRRSHPGLKIEVGGLPEAAGFTPDGRYLLVDNCLDRDSGPTHRLSSHMLVQTR
jgi:hypothetical protein